MTRRDDMRVAKALQGAQFPADKQYLLDYATTREAGPETLEALHALPDGRYTNQQEVVDAVPQEPEGADAPGGTERVADA